MLLRSKLESYDVRWATTDSEIARQHGIEDVSILPDCNINTPLRAANCTFSALHAIIYHRPHIVISTGAAPGFFCLIAGRLIGAKTLWLDSIANGQQLSMCGKLSRRFAHECLTQWPDLAEEPRVKYRGAVL